MNAKFLSVIALAVALAPPAFAANAADADKAGATPSAPPHVSDLCHTADR